MPNPAVKKVCKNNPKYFYTGKESSPLGLGYCALSENVGTKRIGNDDTQWIVGMKNGMRVWVRCPTELSKESPVIEKPTKIVIEDESEEEEAPQNKAPAKKLPPPESSSESESEEEAKPPPKKAPVKKAPVKKPPPESSSESESEEEAKPPPKKPPPKKAPVKKPPPPPESSSESESEAAKPPVKKEAEKKAPVKRAQTDYNIYMAWKVAELGKEEPKMTHKEKFAMAAKEWKNLGDKKEEQMAKAKAFKK